MTSPLTCKKNLCETFLALSTIVASASAFGGVATVIKSSSWITSSSSPVTNTYSGDSYQTLSSSSTSCRPALIYGWDGHDEDTATVEDNTSTSSYLDDDSELIKACSPEGTAVAEALSYDKDRTGHLARLAVAFSPPERALTLQDIENVDVICVYDDSIEIQAIVCEDGGCVSLSVPVKFPVDCHSENPTEHLEGCVLQNLQELDEEAGTLLLIQEQKTKTSEEMATEFQELCLMNERVDDFPPWWVAPQCDESLSADCEAMRSLLNDDEFQADVNALAQDALRKLEHGEDYKVLQAKVALVGPAGMCFKVRAEYELDEEKPVHILDVVHPFGGDPMTDVDALRAAILGAVAAAEGN